MLVDALGTSGERAEDLGSHVADTMCVGDWYCSFCLTCESLDWPFCDQQIIENLIQTVLWWKGKWQNRYVWLCIWFYALDSEEEILFILHMWKRKMLFPDLLFPLCVFVVLEERRSLGIHNICGLSAKTYILNLPFFFFLILCVLIEFQNFAQRNYVLRYFY